MSVKKPTIVVAGASGFIGQALGASLGQTNRLIGLSRSNREPSLGYSEFRNHQEEVVRHLLNGEEVLVLMATGSGAHTQPSNDEGYRV